MNNQPPAGRALDTVMAAALTIPAAEWRAICLVDDHEHGAMWCYQCHGLVAAQPRVPERYSTDIAASEQFVAAMHARGHICQEWSSENVYACVFEKKRFIFLYRTAPTRPLAHCYAALAALAAEEEEEVQ